MEEYLKNVFEQADVNGDGFLDHTEFKALLRNADLGLSNSEIRRVLAEADEDEDGMINYHEFVPVAVQVLQGYHARKHAMDHKVRPLSTLSNQNLKPECPHPAASEWLTSFKGLTSNL